MQSPDLDDEYVPAPQRTHPPDPYSYSLFVPAGQSAHDDIGGAEVGDDDDDDDDDVLGSAVPGLPGMLV